MAIARFGLRELLPASVRLVSGPGCPVCVTAHRDLDHIVALARLPEVTLVTFGDLVRVPASRSSLAAERAAGADVRVVYSPRDAVELAAAAPERQVVFAGIGFETTAPTVAAAVLEARQRGLANFSVLSLHKTMPPPLRALLELGETPLQGFVLPGHVSVVTGLDCYRFLADEYGVGGVVTGFAAHDVLRALLQLLRMEEPADRQRVHARRAARGQPRRARRARPGLRARRRRLARARRDPRLGTALQGRVRRLRRRAPLRRRPRRGRSSPPGAAAARCCAASSTRPSAPSSARAARPRTRSAPAWSRARAPARRATGTGGSMTDAAGRRSVAAAKPGARRGAPPPPAVSAATASCSGTAAAAVCTATSSPRSSSPRSRTRCSNGSTTRRSLCRPVASRSRPTVTSSSRCATPAATSVASPSPAP